MSKLYIDFSETCFSDLNTGIQRVVRNIVSRRQRFQEFDFDETVPIVQLYDVYYRLNDKGKSPCKFSSALQYMGATIRNSMDFIYYKFRSRNDSTLSGEGCSSSQSTKEVSSEDHESGLYWSCIRLLRKIFIVVFRFVQLLDSLYARKYVVKFEPKDVLFLPDAFWSFYFSVSAIKEAKQSGCIVIPLIYDVIPITHPQFCSKSFSVEFIDKFPDLLLLADAYLCISDFSRLEVMRVAEDYLGKEFKLPSDYVYLGCDFALGTERDHGQEFPYGDFYLMVGSIEPRKNHDYALDSFHSYWEGGGESSLVLVGRVGWYCEDTLRKITGSPYYGQKLFWLNDVGDTELLQLYSSCRALVFSSVVEGFGLPLVEAMMFGKDVFASDIPVFREVGGDYPFYFNLHDDTSLSGLLKMNDDGQLVRASSAPSTLSWDEAVDVLAHKIKRLVDLLGGEEKVTST